MADPRFFENLGPFTLAQICEKTGIALSPAPMARGRFSMWRTFAARSCGI